MHLFPCKFKTGEITLAIVFGFNVESVMPRRQRLFDSICLAVDAFVLFFMT